MVNLGSAHNEFQFLCIFFTWSGGTAKELGSNLTRPVFSTEIVRLKIVSANYCLLIFCRPSCHITVELFFEMFFLHYTYFKCSFLPLLFVNLLILTSYLFFFCFFFA